MALRILDTAEALIRRHGPAKVTVVDVARSLGMSHGNVYRHFPSKAALREAVVARWLHAGLVPLAPIVAGDGPAPERLMDYFRTLSALKRRKVLNDPEVFEAYHGLAEEHRDVIAAHLARMHGQVETILRQGVAAGDWRIADIEATAVLLLEATLRFHHPHHLREGGATPEKLDAVLGLLVAGLRAG